MSFYGIVAMVVWVAGTKMNYPVNSRIVIIALILLTLPFALIIGYVASRRKAKKEKPLKKRKQRSVKAERKNRRTPNRRKVAAPAETNGDLAKGAEEVAQFLKTSNLDVYSLPWYLVMGTPKAGKSSLVLGSNLNFQNLPSQRQSEQKFIRPTRNIDWRVTSEAVFVDTAGRYQTEGVDGEEWSSLLETIKKYRGARPLDGMILSVSAERVLHADEKEIEERQRHHRGDEDGGRHHRPEGGQGRSCRRFGDGAGRRWRSAGGGQLTRIVAGTLGGRRIAVPRTGTRPTTDRVRESLFNVLAARIDFAGATVLDLYAGSGALGLEALSRGAASALFVEADQRAAAVIAKNIESLGVQGATVRRGAVAAVLAAGADRPVDLVLADPPYDVPAAEIEAVLAALTNGWTTAGTVVVVERGTTGAELSWPDGWQSWPSRSYGDTRLELAERT